MLTKHWIVLPLLTIVLTAPAVAQIESSQSEPPERAPVVAAKWPFRFGKNLFSKPDDSKDPFLTAGAAAQQDLARQLAPASSTTNTIPRNGFDSPQVSATNNQPFAGRPYPWPAPVDTQAPASLPNSPPSNENKLSSLIPPVPASTATTWGESSEGPQSKPVNRQQPGAFVSSPSAAAIDSPAQVIQTQIVSAERAAEIARSSTSPPLVSRPASGESSASLARYAADAPAPASYPRPEQPPMAVPTNSPSGFESSPSNQYASPAPRFSPGAIPTEALNTSAVVQASPGVTTYQAGAPTALPSSVNNQAAVAQATHQPTSHSASRDTDFVATVSQNQQVTAVNDAMHGSPAANAPARPGVGPIDQDIWGPSFATAVPSPTVDVRPAPKDSEPSSVARSPELVPATSPQVVSGSPSQGPDTAFRRDPRVALLDDPELKAQSIPGTQRAIDTRGTHDEGTDVLAVVGNQTILKGDVLGQVNEQLAPYRQQVSPQELAAQRDLIIQNLLPRLVEQKLIFYDFLKVIPIEKLPELEKVVFDNFNKKKLPEILEKTGLKTATELDAKLRELGSSLATQQRLYFEQMLAAEAVNRQVERDPEISHEEMLEYYNQHASEYEFPAKVRWEQLSVQADQFSSWQQAYNALVQMGNAVKQGAAFEQVAAASSQGPRASSGGQYDWTTQGSLVSKELDRVLFSIKPGEMSKIISDAGNYYIVRVKQRTPAGRQPFMSVQADIKTKIQQQRFQSGVEEYVQRLRRETYVWMRGNGEVIPSQFTETQKP